jgi:iron complex transport system substrate-binding protein
MKIVSLLPSATEIVYFLGLQDELRGITHECDHPPAAASKPVVSTTSLPSIDGLEAGEIDRMVSAKMAAGEPLYRVDEDLISRIRPDLIIAQDLCHVCAVPSGQINAALHKLGCRAEVISLDPKSLDDILNGIDRVAQACGSDHAHERVDRLRARTRALRSRADKLARPKTIALEWPDPPFSGGHWIPEMVHLAGGVDVLGRPGERSQRVSWGQIAGAGPDVIAFMPCGYGLSDAITQLKGLYEVEEFSSTPAARAGRVYALDAYSYYSRPGPRIIDGLEMLAWALHPDVFDPPPPSRIERVIC